MVRSIRTRYFLFTKVNPSDKDVDVLLKGCEKVNATFIGYHVIQLKTKSLLKGFFVLNETTCHTCHIEQFFPNFLLQTMPVVMEIDFKRTEMPLSLKLLGSHPYKAIKKNLFKKEFSKSV
jgi:hypothetical protein